MQRGPAGFRKLCRKLCLDQGDENRIGRAVVQEFERTKKDEKGLVGAVLIPRDSTKRIGRGRDDPSGFQKRRIRRGASQNGSADSGVWELLLLLPLRHSPG